MMPAKLVTYDSQNYAGTLGSGLIIDLHQKGYHLNETCFESYSFNLFDYCKIIKGYTGFLLCECINVSSLLYHI